jgi:hypothetical protein
MSEQLVLICPACGGIGRVWDDRIQTHRICYCQAVKFPPPDVNPVAPAGIETADDVIRLNKQQARVWAVMLDGFWHTPKELEARTGDEWASISARLRDLRKSKYGGHWMERQSLGGGLYRYRLLVNPRARMM